VIPPLADWRGEHVATVTLDHFENLASYAKTAKATGAERDFVLTIEEPLESGRIALYLNGAESKFRDECLAYFTLSRPTLTDPLFLGLRPWGQAPLGDVGERGGVTVIAGWEPITDLDSPVPFIYIRGE
jgi:hypothetical protein